MGRLDGLRDQRLAAAVALTVLVGAGVAVGWTFRPEGGSGTGELSFVRNGNSIYRVNENGASLRKLRGSEHFAYESDWSPDGQRIVFVEDCRLHVMNADGSGVKLLHARTHYCERQPAWSPDGRRIAFSARSSGDAALIAVTDIRGSTLQAVSQKSLSAAEAAYLEDQYPDWSPDGKRIAFARKKHTGISLGNPDPAVFVMNADGTGLRRLPPERTAEALNMPRWSPDGSRLTMGVTGGASLNNQMFVYVAKASGRDYRKLTPTLNQDEMNKGMTGEGWPVWSPDGSRIAFRSDRGIGVMNADGTGRRMVTNWAGDVNPRWRPGTGMSSMGGMGMDWWPWWVTSLVGLLVVAVGSVAVIVLRRPRVRIAAATAVVVAAGLAIAAPVVMTSSGAGSGGGPTMSPGVR